MVSSEGKIVQVITDELEYNKGLKDYLKNKNCMSLGIDYRTVAVIGC
jgi:hypothetical protein